MGLSGSAGEQGSAFCDARNSNNILIGKRAEGLWLRARAEPSWAPRGCLQAPQPAAEPLLGPPGFFSGKRLVAGWRERGCSVSPVPQETHVSPGVRGTSIVPSSSDLPCARTRGLSVDALLLPAPAGSQFSPSPPHAPAFSGSWGAFCLRMYLWGCWKPWWWEPPPCCSSGHPQGRILPRVLGFHVSWPAGEG